MNKKHAEKVKKYLARRKLMDNNYRIFRSDEFIYFPLVSGRDRKGMKSIETAGGKLVDFRFERSHDMLTYRDALEKRLGGRYENATKGYDIVGDIAIIESEDQKSGAAMAKAIMELNRNVGTVLRKAGAVEGRYRVRKYRYVAGRRRYDTVYRENGASFKVDVRKAFFSPRLAYERDRIRRSVSDGENVVVMFAGVGPFAIEIAKMHKNAKVIAMELNREAYKYMLANTALNNTHNVVPELGDVKRLSKKHRGFADRIVMPLPKDSYSFLDSVLCVAKPRCTVHYYGFGDRRDAFKHHIDMLREFFTGRGRRFRVLYKRTVRTYSPSQIEVAIDFLIY